MIFCVVAEGSVGSVQTLPECDIAVFGFNGLGEVDYESEIKGQTENFDRAARLSKNAECGLLCGCKTKTRGVLRKSVAVSDRGRLLGISDMTHVIDGEDYKSGASLGFYKVSGCNVGLCIENDLLFPDSIKSLTACGCNVIVAVMEELKDTLPPLLIRAYSYLYGVPIIMCAGKTAYFADISGAIATSTQKTALFEITPQSRYHIVTTRVKGISADEKEDY